MSDALILGDFALLLLLAVQVFAQSGVKLEPVVCARNAGQR